MRCFLMMIAVVGLVGCGESSEVKAAKAKAAAEAEREKMQRIVDDLRVTKLSVPDHTFVPKPEPGLNDFTTHPKPSTGDKEQGDKEHSPEAKAFGVLCGLVFLACLWRWGHHLPSSH